MITHLSAKDMVHHGVEALVSITVSTWMVSSLSSACLAYAVAKMTYLVSRRILDEAIPQWPLEDKRKFSWGLSLIAATGALKISVSAIMGISWGVLSALSVVLVAAASALSARTFADRTYQYLNDKTNNPFSA